MIDIRPGDCLAVMRGMIARGEVVQAVITDPPYGLTSTSDRFGKPGAAPAQPGVYARQSAGFMGKLWDGTGIAFDPETWRLCYDLLPPGGYLLAMGGTRTYHRMVVAIEDAGFEIRDCVTWLYGTGFPKSHDVGKAIDKTLGKKGVFGARKPNVHSRGDHVLNEGWKRPWMEDADAVDKSGREYLPATPEAQKWNGWGSALKPAVELICVARKPLIGTLAQNVLAHGVGGLNTDACRIRTDEKITNHSRSAEAGISKGIFSDSLAQDTHQTAGQAFGRWPANLAHDGSDEVEAAFAAFGERTSGKPLGRLHVDPGRNVASGASKGGVYMHTGFGDSGSASRFFFSSKASKLDRANSRHPTVKPVNLIRWLTRLVTPPGGTVLDPFVGSGTTGAAALAEGFNAILIEKEQQYLADIYRRFGREPAHMTAWRQWGEALERRGKVMNGAVVRVPVEDDGKPVTLRQVKAILAEARNG